MGIIAEDPSARLTVNRTSVSFLPLMSFTASLDLHSTIFTGSFPSCATSIIKSSILSSPWRQAAPPGMISTTFI